jgi:integrase
LESATPVTFRQILERYREQVTPQKKSHRHEANRISRLLKEPIADTNATDLTPGMIAAFRDRRLASVGPQAVIHDLTLLGHVIRIAINEWDLPLAENPVLKVRKPKPPQGRTRRLEEGELKRLIVAVETFTAPYMVDLIYFAVETAMRQSEILRLNWGDINWEARTAIIRDSKNGLPRTLPLSTKAIGIVKRRQSSDLRSPFPYHVRAVQRAWDITVRRACSRDLHFHDLRHEAISLLFEKGLSVPEVALISGHKDPRMLFRYTHMTAAEIAKKLD